MTLRERIADWLTGGALSKARQESSNWAYLYRNAKADFRIATGATAEWAGRHLKKERALRAISAEAKRGKNPNSTVRRMGKMADEALG